MSIASALGYSAAVTARKISEWRESPERFVREVFGASPDPWQAQALHKFRYNPRLAMKACKGPGKTCVLAWICWNFLLTRPHPKIVATSITADNLSDGLWTEMAKWQKQSVNKCLDKAFKWTATRIFAVDDPETHYMVARAWSRSASPEAQADTLAGKHADYMLFILDESGGIPSAVMAAAEAALASGVECHLVQAGNPTTLEGPLYRAATVERHLWTMVEITGDPDDPNRSSRVSIQWARDQIESWGRDNPWVMVNVLGKFPPASINALLGPDDVSIAMRRVIPKDQYAFAARVIGVDIARMGDDRTVMFPRQGVQAFKPVIMRNARTQDIAARLAIANEKFQPDAIFIDDGGGYAAGAIDAALDLGMSLIPVSFAGKAFDPRYYNRRAEMHFNAAEWVKNGGALPNDPQLAREAVAATYTLKRDKLIVQDKDEIKAVLQVSPDIWDAFILTHAAPVVPRPRAISGTSMIPVVQDRALAEWNPYEESRT